MITANEARKAMAKVLQAREDRANENAKMWVNDVVNAAIAQAVENGEGHTPSIQADSEDIAKRAEQELTAEPYCYKVVRQGTKIVVVWHE